MSNFQIYNKVISEMTNINVDEIWSTTEYKN